jgi:hypothetical protein
VQAALQRGITWLKRITKTEVDPVESITVEAPIDMLVSKLPGWIIQDEPNNRCLIIKEFHSKDHGNVLVALLPTRAIVFRNPDGSILDTDVFLTYLLRNRVPQVQTIVCYNEEYNCYTWLCDPLPLFEPDILSEITDAMGALVDYI